MGEHESWAEPPRAVLLNGLLPNEASSVIRELDSERWSKAEERTAELIGCIQPNTPSEERRNAVADYVQRLIMKCFPSQVKVVTFGSVPLKTYLPDGDIDLTAFSGNPNVKETWAHQVRDMLENEEKNENAEFRVKEVQYIQAEVKIIKCLVENIVVDISFDQLGGLCTLCFLVEIDGLINQNHLFKRSIILIKAWCYYESRILGAHHGLISTYALETLVLYIFHVFNNSFAGPLEVLYRFLEFFSKFDWENFCVSLWGPVPISSLPNVTAEPPRKDGGELLLSKLFLEACSKVYSAFPGGQENQGLPFVSKHFNVIDPLRLNNNLGRSVSKGNFFRIRSAFAFGAKRLARVLDCPKEQLYFEVNQFFLNTWDRHGSGSRPDAPGNDLRRLRLSDPDQLHGSEHLRNDSASRNNVVPPVSQTQSPKVHGNVNKSRNLIRQELSSNHYARNDKGQKSSKPSTDKQGKFLFARTQSSPELTDTYSEASFQGRRSGKSQIASARLDNSRRKLEADNDGRSTTEDPLSVRHLTSHQGRDTGADSNSDLSSYHDELGLNVMGEEFASAFGTQGMHQEEQDLVNIMAASSGQVHMPLNLASGHIPLPIPPSVFASMAYGYRNLAGMFPTNIPLDPRMQIPHGLTHYFPGIGLTPNPEDSIEHFGSREMNHGEANHDYWHEQDRGLSELDDGVVEALQSEGNVQSTSAGYGSGHSSRASSSGRVHQKFKVSPKEDHLETSSRNEAYFDDKSVSSRPISAARASSLKSKTSSESSWEGSSASSAKASRSGKEKWGRKITPSTLPSSQADDDDNRDWNELETESVASLNASRHQMPESEQAQTSGSDSLIPMAPMLFGPGSRQRAMDSSDVAPFTFYPTGPPVPFVTMLPFYNYQTETATPDALSNHRNVEEQLDHSASVEVLEHKPDILHSDFVSHWQNLQYGRFCQNSCNPEHMLYPSPVVVPPVYLRGRFPWDGPGRPPLTGNMNLFSQLMNHRPHLVPPQSAVPNRPSTAYQRYADEMPRYRSGTGTYLPNPKVPGRDQYSSSSRRGNYNYDRNEHHHSEREGNWSNSKARGSGRRSQAEKQSSRSVNGSRPWSSSHRQDSYQSHNGPLHSNSTQNSAANSVYPMGPGPNGSTLAPVVMLYPYDHNTAEQLEFGSLGPVGLNEAAQLNGEQRFQMSSPDQPSLPHQHR